MQPTLTKSANPAAKASLLKRFLANPYTYGTAAAIPMTMAEYQGYNPFMASLKDRNPTGIQQVAATGLNAASLGYLIKAMRPGGPKLPLGLGIPLAATALSTPIMHLIDPGIQALENNNSRFDASQSSERNKLLLGAGLGVGALGLGALGVRQAYKARRQMEKPKEVRDPGLVRITLPTKNPNDTETQIELPLNTTHITQTAMKQMQRDLRRRLRDGGAERTYTRLPSGELKAASANDPRLAQMERAINRWIKSSAIPDITPKTQAITPTPNAIKPPAVAPKIDIPPAPAYNIPASKPYVPESAADRSVDYNKLRVGASPAQQRNINTNEWTENYLANNAANTQAVQNSVAGGNGGYQAGTLNAQYHQQANRNSVPETINAPVQHNGPANPPGGAIRNRDQAYRDTSGGIPVAFQGMDAQRLTSIGRPDLAAIKTQQDSAGFAQPYVPPLNASPQAPTQQSWLDFQAQQEAQNPPPAPVAPPVEQPATPPMPTKGWTNNYTPPPAPVTPPTRALGPVTQPMNPVWTPGQVGSQHLEGVDDYSQAPTVAQDNPTPDTTSGQQGSNWGVLQPGVNALRPAMNAVGGAVSNAASAYQPWYEAKRDAELANRDINVATGARRKMRQRVPEERLRYAMGLMPEEVQQQSAEYNKLPWLRRMNYNYRNPQKAREQQALGKLYR